MKQQKSWFKGSGNYQLYGVLTLPSKTKHPPLVIMLHGFGAGATDKGYYQLFSINLAKTGIASFYYDRMGLGKSTGDFRYTKHTNDLKDLHQIINTLLNTFTFNPKKIAILGTSSGGFLAIIHAAKDNRIKYLCLKAPEVNAPKFWQKQPGFKNWAKTNLLVYLNKTTGGKLSLHYSFYQDILQLNALTAAKKLTIPVLSIHGDKDTTAPLQGSKLLLKALASKDKQLKIIKGANHGFEGHVEEQNQAIINWLIHKLT